MSKKVITFYDSEKQEHDFPIITPDYGVCDTIASDANKIVTCDEFTLFTGATVTVNFKNAPTTNTISLNVNDSGLIAVDFNSNDCVAKDEIKANGCYDFVYNGTKWIYKGSSANKVDKVSGKSLIDKSFADKVSTSGNTTTIDNQLKTYSITTRLEADVAITGLDENGQEVIKHKLSEKANSSEVNNKVDKVSGKSLVDAQDIRTAIESDSLTFTGKQKVKLRAEASDETWMTTIDANGVTIATPTQEVALTDSSIIVSNNSGEGITINPQEVVIKDAQGQKIHSLSEKVNKSDVLTKTNTTEFTPTADYQPATKKYVDDNKLSNIANGETTGTIKIGRTGSQRADGPYSTIIGFGGHTGTDALGSVAIANGECLANYTVAIGTTVASGNNQLVFGRYNVKDTENKYACIIGNGTSDTARSNAHTVDWDGNAWFVGDVEGTKDGATHKLSEKANVADVLTKTNTTAFTPTADYQPATKKYVDNITSSFVSGKVTTITVPTTGWTTSTDTNGTTYYTRNITNSALTSTGYPITDVVLPGDIAAARLQSEAYQNVNKITVNDGSVTLYCFDSLPTVSFQIRIQLLYI